MKQAIRWHIFDIIIIPKNSVFLFPQEEGLLELGDVLVRVLKEADEMNSLTLASASTTAVFEGAPVINRNDFRSLPNPPPCPF